MKEEIYKDNVDPDFPEVKSTEVNTCVVKESDVIVERLLRFSSWHKAKVAVALCLRYNGNLREKVMSKGKESSAGKKEQGCVSKAQFNVELFMHSFIPIWVDPDDKNSMVDLDVELN